MRKRKKTRSPLEAPVPGDWHRVVGENERDFFKTEFHFHSKTGLLSDPARAVRGLFRDALESHVRRFGEASACVVGKRVSIIHLSDRLVRTTTLSAENPWRVHSFLRTSAYPCLLDGDFKEVAGEGYGKKYFSRPWSDGLPVFFALSERSFFEAREEDAPCLHTPPMEGDLFVTPRGTVSLLRAATERPPRAESFESDSEDESEYESSENDRSENSFSALLFTTECYECEVYDMSFSDTSALIGRQKPLVVVPHPFEISAGASPQVVETLKAFLQEVECKLGFGRLRTIKAMEKLVSLTEQDLLALYSQLEEGDWMSRIILKEYFLRAPWITTRAVKDIEETKVLPLRDAAGRALPYRQHFRLRDIVVDNEDYKLDATEDLYARKEMRNTHKGKNWMRWRVFGWNATSLYLRCERGYESCFEDIKIKKDSVLKNDVEETLVRLCDMSERWS